MIVIGTITGAFMLGLYVGAKLQGVLTDVVSGWSP